MEEAHDLKNVVPLRRQSQVIFCIDSTEAMFGGEDNEGKCFLQRCFQCIWKRIDYNLMIKEQEFVWILLMGARSRMQSTLKIDDILGAANLVELKSPAVNIFEKLFRYMHCNAKEFTEDFKKDYISDDYSLEKVLSYCESISTNEKEMLLRTRIPKEVILFTCQDQEHLDVVSRQQACTTAKALMLVGISLRLFYLGKQFRINNFYKELLLSACPLNKEVDGTATNLDEKPFDILLRPSLNRHYDSVDLTISPGFDISVFLYNIHRNDGVYGREELDNDEKRDSSNRLGVKIGRKRTDNKMFVGFEKNELNSMEDPMYTPGLFMLGFKPVCKIAQENFLRPGLVVLPDDNARPGSSTCFYAFLKSCLNKGVAPICRFTINPLISKKNTSPRIVVLVPQKQGESTTSPGSLTVACFHALIQPFSGEFRTLSPYIKHEQNNVIKFVEKNIENCKTQCELAEIMTSEDPQRCQALKNPHLHAINNGIKMKEFKDINPDEKLEKVTDPIVVGCHVPEWLVQSSRTPRNLQKTCTSSSNCKKSIYSQELEDTNDISFD